MASATATVAGPFPLQSRNPPAARQRFRGSQFGATSLSITRTGAASTIAAGAAPTNYSFTDTTSAAVNLYSTAIGGFWGGLLVSG